MNPSQNASRDLGQPPLSPGRMPVPSRARWFAAVFSILYGFAKLNGSQFTVIDSELAKPMGDVSGFWLTWYRFFERNRAHWVTFRSATGDEWHHFEVDREGIVRVWERWLSKGALIMQGRVLPDGDLQLDAMPGAALGSIRLHRTGLPHEEPSILAAFRRQRT